MPAATLRRRVLDPPFNPLQLKPLLWYKGEKTFGYADGAVMATWPDISGNGNDAVQAGVGNKPSWKRGALNNKAGVLFGGVSHWMVTTVNVTAGPASLYVVASDASAATGFRGIFVASKIALYAAGSAAAWLFYLGGEFTSGIDLTSTHALLEAVVRSGTDFDMGTNGAMSVKVGAGYGARANTGIGGDASGVQFHNGEIIDLIVFGTPHTNGERARMQDYFRRDYALRMN
jgi:hypothetical protein